MEETSKQEKNRLIYVLLAGVGFLVLAFLGIFAGRIFNNGYSLWENNQVSLSPTLPVQEGQELVEIKVGEVVLNVEIARTQDELEKGLSGRDKLAERAGMLFVFENPGVPTFWMKGMRFPLDILWIADGKVVGFEENVPPADGEVHDANIPRYSPTQPVTAVLEVNAGFVEKRNIQVGAPIEFSNLEPSL